MTYRRPLPGINPPLKKLRLRLPKQTLPLIIQTVRTYLQRIRNAESIFERSRIANEFVNVINGSPFPPKLANAVRDALKEVLSSKISPKVKTNVMQALEALQHE